MDQKDATDATTGETPSSVLSRLEARRRRHAIDAEAFRATLAGLTGVHAQIEPLNADAERDGLTAADLRADVESALRESGLTVYGQSALVADVPGTPFLHVDVMTIRLDGRYAYSVRLELWQAVTLLREPRRSALALTWAAPQVVGTVAAESLAELRDTVRSEVYAFVGECRAATDQIGGPQSAERSGRAP